MTYDVDKAQEILGEIDTHFVEIGKKLEQMHLKELTLAQPHVYVQHKLPLHAELKKVTEMRDRLHKLKLEYTGEDWVMSLHPPSDFSVEECASVQNAVFKYIQTLKNKLTQGDKKKSLKFPMLRRPKFGPNPLTYTILKWLGSAQYTIMRAEFTRLCITTKKHEHDQNDLALKTPGEEAFFRLFKIVKDSKKISEITSKRASK